MTQDVIVEPTADVADNDVIVDEAPKLEPEVQDEPADVVDESQEDGEGEEEQKPKTVEEKLAEAEANAEKSAKAQEAMQKKIDRQTAAYNNMQKALEKQRQESQEALEKSKAVEIKEPNIDDFETHDDYVEAVAEFRAESKIAAKEAEYAQRQEQARVQQIAQERTKIANEQEAEYLKINPRYGASKSEFEGYIATAKVNPQVEDAIVTMAYEGNIPQLIEYFGSNNGERIEELDAITQMSPIKAAVEIYKIQQKLVAPKPVQTKPLPKPVKAAPANKSSKSIDAMSGDDFMKRMGLK